MSALPHNQKCLDKKMAKVTPKVLDQSNDRSPVMVTARGASVINTSISEDINTTNVKVTTIKALQSKE